MRWCQFFMTFILSQAQLVLTFKEAWLFYGKNVCADYVQLNNTAFKLF